MRSILVVEDDRSTRQLVTETLKTAGFSVVVVIGFVGQRATPPACRAHLNRRAEGAQGTAKRGEQCVGTTARNDPVLLVAMPDRKGTDGWPACIR
jgi:CheY-like chemotaxis protein